MDERIEEALLTLELILDGYKNEPTIIEGDVGNERILEEIELTLSNLRGQFCDLIP